MGVTCIKYEMALDDIYFALFPNRCNNNDYSGIVKEITEFANNIRAKIYELEEELESIQPDQYSHTYEDVIRSQVELLKDIMK